ncbi:MAG: hypothetical protein ACRENB_02085 [Gemmatimonadales bacterium]
MLPRGVLLQAVAAWNDSLTARISGHFVLPPGARLTGTVAVYRGNLRVQGTIAGSLTVINGDLVIEPGGAVEGDVLVVGGRIDLRPGGLHSGGTRRAYAETPQLYRANDGTLAIRDRPITLGEIASARRTITSGHFTTTINIETGRTYNRIEGLPLVFGPTIAREGLPDVDGRLDLRGIVWTAPDRSDRRADFGYLSRLEFRFGESRRLLLGGRLYRLVTPTEESPLSRSEAGWASFLLQRDYRDYVQSTGVGGYASYALTRHLTLEGSLDRAAERSIPANDPISLLRNQAWRPNALIDDGHYTTWRAGLALDTRNDLVHPTAGWLVRARVEHGRSTDASPLSLPPDVRDPVPAGERYAFSSFWVDARRYARFNPSVRTSLRVVGGGWLDGDPLPVQRRLSLGGPDILPGYPFRAFNCVPPTLSDPAHPALCDRLLAVQLEVRTRSRIGLPLRTNDPYLAGLQRLLGIVEPDVVIFGDAGKAWLAGDGPGRVPSDRLPNLDEWKYDLGFGMDAGGIGVYIAQPFTDGRPLTITVRLQRRF